MIIHWGIGLVMGVLVGAGVMCLMQMAKGDEE